MAKVVDASTTPFYNFPIQKLRQQQDGSDITHVCKNPIRMPEQQQQQDGEYFTPLSDIDIFAVVQITRDRNGAREKFLKKLKATSVNEVTMTNDELKRLCPYSASWLIKKLMKRAEKISSVSSSTGSGGDILEKLGHFNKHYERFNVWLIFESMLRDLSLNLKKLGVLQKYLVAIGAYYITLTTNGNSGDTDANSECSGSSNHHHHHHQKVEECKRQNLADVSTKLTSLKQLEETRMTVKYGLENGLDDVILAHSETQRMVAYAIIKLCECVLRFVGGVVPGLTERLLKWLKKSCLGSSSYDVQMIKDIFDHLEESKKPFNMEKLDESTLPPEYAVMRNYLEVLIRGGNNNNNNSEASTTTQQKGPSSSVSTPSSSLDSSQCKNYLLGHALLGKLPITTFNPTHGVLSSGTMKQKRTVIQPMSESSSTTTHLDPTSKTFTSGYFPLEKNVLLSSLGTKTTLEFEDMGRNNKCSRSSSPQQSRTTTSLITSQQDRIEDVLRDKRIANHLASLCVMALDKADAALESSLVKYGKVKGGIGLPRKVLKYVNKQEVDDVEEEVLFVDYVTSYSAEFTFLKNSIYRLLEDTFSPSYVLGLAYENSTVKKIKNFDKLFSKYVQSRELGSFRKYKNDDNHGSENVYNIKDAPIKNYDKQEEEKLDKKSLMGLLHLKSRLAGVDKEQTPPPPQQQQSSSSNTDVELTLKDSILLALKDLQKDLNVFSKKVLYRALNFKKRKVEYKPGYLTGYVIRTLETLEYELKSQFYVLGNAVDFVHKYFTRIDGALNKPTIQDTMQQWALFQLYSKNFRLLYRVLAFLTHAPHSGSLETYKVFESTRYVDHSVNAIYYKYNKIQPKLSLQNKYRKEFSDTLPSFGVIWDQTLQGMLKMAKNHKDTLQSILQYESTLSSPPYSHFKYYDSDADRRNKKKYKIQKKNDHPVQDKNDRDDDEEEDDDDYTLRSREVDEVNESKVAMMMMTLSIQKSLSYIQRDRLQDVISIISMIFNVYFTELKKYMENDKSNVGNIPYEIRKKLQSILTSYHTNIYFENNIPASYVELMNSFTNPKIHNHDSVFDVLKKLTFNTFDSMFLINGSNWRNLFYEFTLDTSSSSSVSSNCGQIAEKMLKIFIQMYGPLMKDTTVNFSNYMSMLLHVRQLFYYDTILTDPTIQHLLLSPKQQAVLTERNRKSGVESNNVIVYSKRHYQTKVITDEILKLYQNLVDSVSKMKKFSLFMGPPAVYYKIEEFDPDYVDVDDDDSVTIATTTATTTEVPAATVASVDETPDDGDVIPEQSGTDDVTEPVGADFWANHAKLERDYNKVKEYSENWGFKNGYKKGLEDGILRSRNTPDGAVLQSEAETFRQFIWFERVVGSVVEHLYTRSTVLKEPTTVIVQRDDDIVHDGSTNNWFLKHHELVEDSLQFIEAFNVNEKINTLFTKEDSEHLLLSDMGASSSLKSNQTEYYTEVMWTYLRNPRYAEQWAIFDRCFRTWIAFSQKVGVVRISLNNTASGIVEQLVKNPVAEVDGGIFADVTKYPHPAHMFQVGGIYRNLFGKTKPYPYGSAELAAKISTKDADRFTMKNYYMNMKRSKLTKSYIKRSLILHDWVITNMMPYMLIFYKEMQKYAGKKITTGESFEEESSTSLDGYDRIKRVNKNGLVAFKTTSRTKSGSNLDTTVDTGMDDTTNNPEVTTATSQKNIQHTDYEDEDQDEQHTATVTELTKGRFGTGSSLTSREVVNNKTGVRSNTTTLSTDTVTPTSATKTVTTTTTVTTPIVDGNPTVGMQQQQPQQPPKGISITKVVPNTLPTQSTNAQYIPLQDTPTDIYLKFMEMRAHLSTLDLVSEQYLLGPSLSLGEFNVMTASTPSPTSDHNGSESFTVTMKFIEEFLRSMSVVIHEFTRASQTSIALNKIPNSLTAVKPSKKVKNMQEVIGNRYSSNELGEIEYSPILNSPLDAFDNIMNDYKNTATTTTTTTKRNSKSQQQEEEVVDEEAAKEEQQEDVTELNENTTITNETEENQDAATDGQEQPTQETVNGKFSNSTTKSVIHTRRMKKVRTTSRY